ncbi:hypothetical protein BCR34DRAFT_587756 [Clohesyomyces aquaticus]|uniref:Uncharacterized protein n=1 Tax=Clohesyomyces aquaticus TaxID=1231657 RepID=A0A1Y1ZN12_9PLEO|nr:hypothetical protein BCR34DRAFT_587756 [Clohesyomyces aquaticus]
MEPPNLRKGSTDITARQALARPPSPAPTYCSTFHSEKDLRHSPTDSKSNFETVEEPFDTNHPHYVRENHNILSLQQLPALPPKTRKRRLPPLRIIVPWTLALIFFLITLWYTSILVGARFLDILSPKSSPTQPINVVINGLDASPPVQIGTEPAPTTTTSFARVPPQTSLRPLPTGNGFDPDPGTNTVTRKPDALPSGKPSSGFVTVTKGGI